MGNIFGRIDGITTAILVGISCIGLFTLLTIDQSLFLQQAGFILLGLLLMVIISRIDGVFLQYFGPYFYILSVLSIAATYLFPDVRGAARWIFLGPVQIQPAEIAKPFFLLSFACFMAGRSPRNIKHVLLLLLLFLLPFLLVMKQPDLGTSIVYFSSWFAMLFAGGLPFWSIFLFAFLGLVAAPFGWHLLEPFQRLRIITFLNPTYDQQGAGYNALQAMIAVGSGQLFGRGLGRGTQSHLQFLPEFHTDFIFATIIEELGFMGGMVLFFLYGLLLWRLVRPLIIQEDIGDVSFFYAIGVFAMIFTQLVVNAGMNMGIIPITGITLPLVSSGGSSVIAVYTSFGILFSLRGVGRRRGIAIMT